VTRSPAPVDARLDELLDELLPIAGAAVDSAARFLAEGWGGPREAISTKSTGTDMVSEMDRGAERILVDAIVAARPGDGILGEEGADRPSSTGVRWVIDPLDGTTNYLYGLHHWCVSVGIELHGEPVVGIVSAPALGDRFVGTKGRVSTRNARPIGVSGETDLARALIATGFGYAPARRAAQGRVVAALVPRVRDLRRCGSAALDLCAVATGLVDGYYEVGVNPWDVCAGAVIVAGAGGVTSAPIVTPRSPPGVEVGGPGRPFVATNAVLHALLVDALRVAHEGIDPA
jgi:myo-inositol-1(or 4)-monophosphatase